jgi:CubicO group peptidase (beta-lactamase class C family)
VTTRTLFPIASVTKSFTVATLAVLVRQGKLAWDRPVREYLPDLRLWDASTTERITARDLVTHRSGLTRHNWVWLYASLSREDLYQRLRYLQPSADLRHSFQYTKLMSLAAGCLVERLAGSTWEETTQETIFTPLGMERANFSITYLQLSDDYAHPYERDEDENVHQGPFIRAHAVGPAGGINASVAEMIRYVAMHLDAGHYQGCVIISERDAREMQTPQIVIHDDPQYPEPGHTQYGMGFYISSYRGHKHVYHDGGIRGGFSSIVSFLPDDGIGAVVVSNISSYGLTRIVTLRVFDQLLGLAPVPWSAHSGVKGG